MNESSPALLWTGRVLTALAALGLAASASMKLMQAPALVENLQAHHFDPGVVPIIGAIELACVVLYLVPQTAVLGAILIAAYLGGATAVHVAAGESPAAPIILAMIAWAGLGLRDARLRELLPLRKG